MPVLSLPLTFTNSFWSQDYRRGLDVLYTKLDQGLVENEEVIAFIRARSNAQAQLAASIALSPSLRDKGFGADDGASLLMAFRGLQEESISQSKVHDNIAKELNSLVIAPFSEWAQGYKDRLKQSKSTVFHNWFRSYEQAHTDVQKLRQQYLAKTRRADDAEDDAKFAPTGAPLPDKYTTSPRLQPADPQRTTTVSERISQRLRDIQQKGSSTSSPSSAEEERPTKVDKGKQKAVEVEDVPSPSAMTPLPPPKVDLAPESIILGGIPFTPATVSQMLTRAASELRLRPVRFPLLGEYQDVFSGEEFITWLQESVKEFGGDIDLAETAAQVLTEQEGLLRRLGELGNQFEASDDAFYQFRPKAFDLASRKSLEYRSPTSIKQAESLLKHTNTFVNMVTKALNNGPNGEPAYVHARQEADEADKAYRIAVRILDRQRLALEERLEDVLKTLERWEAERLRAIKTVLLQYQGILANIPKALEQSNERCGTLIAAYQPESDLTALIERYRTGPFRPTAHIYESVSHDDADAVFGIDLRKWADDSWQELASAEDKKEFVPPVFLALLNGLNDAYQRLPSDLEKRKSWIYEVPLVSVHQLRETLNAIQPGQPFSPDLFKGSDAPVIASAVKLWLLELEPPVATYESWEEFRKIYPAVGTKPEGEATEENRTQNVCTALQRLPRIHLCVLDTLIQHLRSLIKSSAVPEESDEVFIAKLALSVGRAIVRPRQETELSIQDRHPTLLFIDLMTKYESILPPTISKKRRESERKVPVRKRTAPIDMRLSRSRISLGADAKELLTAQQVAQNPSLARAKSPAPPLPPPILAKSESQQTVVAPVVPSSDEAATTSETKPFVAPPPPPPLPSQSKKSSVPPPPPLLKNTAIDSAESPPSQDNLPPRPTFKEPPPEDDYTPPMPKFVDPPVENNVLPSTPQSQSHSKLPPSPAPPTTNLIPSSRLKRTSVDMGGSKTGRTTPSSASVTSRSPSPPPEDVVLGSGKSTIARSGSGQSNVGLRGPRTARNPRRGAVANAVANLNRNSISGPVSAASGRPASPTTNRFSTGSPTRRPTMLGRSAALTRRTMASDAEDNVLERK